MKFKSLAIASAMALMVCVFGLSGCTTGTVQAVQPAQIAAVACPQLALVHNQLVALNAALVADPKTAAVGAKATAQLAAIQPIVDGVCNGAAAAPKVDFTTIQSLVQTGFPALATLAASLPLTATQQAQIQAALAVAETAAGVVNALQQAAQPAPASTAAH
jgi:hypothetical protein